MIENGSISCRHKAAISNAKISVVSEGAGRSGEEKL
jgi:hypothetical protein